MLSEVSGKQHMMYRRALFLLAMNFVDFAFCWRIAKFVIYLLLA